MRLDAAYEQMSPIRRLRSLRPLDLETVIESVARTNRLVAIEEGPETGGEAGLLGAVAARGLDQLDDAWLVTIPDWPIPFRPPLEDAFLPCPDRIATSVLEHLEVAA